MQNIDLTGAINGTTAYVDGQLVGRDVTVSLPELAWLTAELQATGTTEIPILGLLEAMETTIKKIGIDNGLVKACTPASKDYEFRWAQTITTPQGSSKIVGSKASIRGIPKTVPGMDVEPGSTVEAEIPIATTRYALYLDGKEAICIDKLAGVIRFDGTDYANSVNAVL